MALETGSFVDDLVSSNPPGSDGFAQGDDHLRLLKSVLKGTFPNATRAFYFENVLSSKIATYTILVANARALVPCDASGGAFTITLPVAATAGAGFVVTVYNTGASGTVTVDGNGAETVNGVANIALVDQYSGVDLWTDGSEWFAMYKNNNPFLASDASKLDNIEANATADQSNAEIKTAYEANTNTNGFSDAEQTLLGNQSGSNTGDEPTATTSLKGISELATTAEGDTGTSTSLVTPVAVAKSMIDKHVPDLFSAAGSAGMFACRAWVNFNGTGTVAIRDSGNVSSITDNGVGNYTVNFTTNMQSTDYGVVIGSNLADTVVAGSTKYVGIYGHAVGSVNIASSASSSGQNDFVHLNVGVFE